MKPELNEGQRAVVGKLIQLTEGGLTVLGEGGTGKTFSIMSAAEEWLKSGLRVAMTAPTNKAVKQLEKAARQHGLAIDKVKFCTIHKALGLALLPDAETKYVKQVGECIFDQYDKVVIDEGSMLSSRAFYDYVLPEAEKANTSLVIMGDKMQLPPPKESESVALQHFEDMELTHVERFKADSGIAKLTSALREVIERKGQFKFNATDYDIEVVKPAHFISKVVDTFDKDTDLEKVRALAWTNNRVDMINDAVRSKIYGKNAATYEIGERVVTGCPVYEDREMLLSTDEECIVRQVQVSSIMDPETGNEYATYLLTLEPIYDDTLKTVYAHVLHESSQLDFTEDLSVLHKKAVAGSNRQMWAKYNQLKDLFSDIRYCYCITIHRSQGSTYETVMVDVDNILRNNRRQERNQLLYVGFSRAAKNLITSKEQFVS